MKKGDFVGVKGEGIIYLESYSKSIQAQDSYFIEDDLVQALERMLN